MRETLVAAQTDQLHAMIAALAGSQALLLDVLRRRGSIAQDDIDYIFSRYRARHRKGGRHRRTSSRGPNDQAMLAAAFNF
jgi:hypothetical protein